ncbi:MAG: hypothetical protein QOE66_3080 [Chloroflexota bacterium]|nr:hypothetical protein [Chloroflexota bacterium]
MTTTTKRGFHLPWSGDDRAPTEPAEAPEQTGREAVAAPEADAPGQAPFSVPARGAPKEATTAVSNPQMSWPDVDRAGSATHQSVDASLPPVRPSVVVDGANGAGEPSPRASRRDNPLVIGLVKAMREAARAAREETTTRMRAEATARMDEIRAGSVAEAAALRKRADDDAIGIREWSKAEIARIRDEAEKRIGERRAELGRETDAHASGIERLVEQVQEVATTFEAEMEQFFEVLLAEEDPARLATLAEQVPDAPVFDALPALKRGSASSRNSGTAKAKGPAGRSAAAKSAAEAADTEAVADTEDPEARLEPDAAAAAEAEAIADLDDSPEDLSADEIAGLLEIDTGSADDAAETSAEQTRVVVTGLTSVAGISAFKGSLGRVPGVTSVSVSTGTDDDFVFAVAHSTTTDLQRAVPAFAGFGAQMTLDDGEVIAFTVKEPS